MELPSCDEIRMALGGFMPRLLAGLHIHALLIEPSSGWVFAGAHKGSIHVSQDGGATWKKQDQGLTAADVYCLSSAVIDGKTKVFAGTEPAHLFASDDLGETWQEIKSLRSVPSVVEMDFSRAAPCRSRKEHRFQSRQQPQHLRVHRAGRSDAERRRRERLGKNCMASTNRYRSRCRKAHSQTIYTGF